MMMASVRDGTLAIWQNRRHRIIADIARHLNFKTKNLPRRCGGAEKTKPLTTKDTKEHQGKQRRKRHHIPIKFAFEFCFKNLFA